MRRGCLQRVAFLGAASRVTPSSGGGAAVGPRSAPVRPLIALRFQSGLSSAEAMAAAAARGVPYVKPGSPAVTAAKPPPPLTLQNADARLPTVRNIGIVAHIDAGKTTTTERMLFFAGSVRRIGDVDSGTTTTDFLEDEMERGITITAAAVTLAWRDHTINLIDTPGHVDFTVEVERSLRVLDGVVALFDASAGVQAQSYTVLRQARKFHTPVIAFVNKMDKGNANFEKTLESIRAKLGVLPLLVQIPLYANNGAFIGVIDLADCTAVRFGGTNGAAVAVTPLDAEGEVTRDAALARRHELLSALSALDDPLAEELIGALERCEGDEAAAEQCVSAASVRAAVRRVTIAGATSATPVIPILCGAARRDMGVQPLLDAVTHFLPSPLDRPRLEGRNTLGEHVPLPKPTASAAANTIALAFKVMHQANAKTGAHDPLVFFRVYGGRVTKGMSVTNARTGIVERVDQLFVMQANVTRAVDFVAAGHIGAAFLNKFSTGDTMFAEGSADAAMRQALLRAEKDAEEKSLRAQRLSTVEGIQAPPAVISFAIEAASDELMPATEAALARFAHEDPSFRLTKNDHGQLVVSGMGELHLEIILSRMQREYGLSCALTKAIIEYRESIMSASRFTAVKGIGHDMVLFKADLEFAPLHAEPETIAPESNTRFAVSSTARSDFVAAQTRRVTGVDWSSSGMGRSKQEQEVSKAATADFDRIVEALESAFNEALLMGPLAQLRVIGVALTVHSVEKIVTNIDPPSLLAAAAGSAIQQVMRGSKDKVLAEPVMSMEVHLNDNKYVGDVMSDLSQREPQSVEILEDNQSIGCVAPLRTIARFGMQVRKVAKGNVYFFADLKHYQVVKNADVKKKIFAEIF